MANKKRKSILDSIDQVSRGKNMFCNIKDLTNESSVELFFISRLLKALGYKDKNIKSKESIDQVTIRTGSRRVNYKPDYVILSGNKPLLVIDAKSPKESVDKYVEQCAHYCLLINRKSNNSVRYFLLSNGINTKLYEWDKDVALLELSFSDFVTGNLKYEQLCDFLCLNNLMSFPKERYLLDTDRYITLKKTNKEEAQKLFRQCHKYIWNTEKRGPNSAFMEFVKLIFLKLFNDKKLHSKYDENGTDSLIVPESDNIFSVNWIEKREKEMVNPINDIQFKDLMSMLNDEVRNKKKKTLFDETEKIDLKSSTVKGVVKKLENFDLYGIDEDLNGRLFETFLNATMRGADLGQFFTPRSIVLLGALLADLEINEKRIDKVLDASCGTGGYLIEALTIMRNKVRNNTSYTDKQKETLIDNLCYNHLFGIDAAKDPKLARIARINMYLHGDGGSHIYMGDGLDKQLHVDKSESKEAQYEAEEMAQYFINNSFDVVLTNPPFSMWYEAKNEAQAKVLSDYKMIKLDGTSKTRTRLRGSAMFIERYCDLLKPGGKLISVIDETVLSSQEYEYVRDFIRKHFIIRAIISLHGDAFQQSKARVKTAMIYLTKKVNEVEKQPDVFMRPSIYLGVDDLPITTKPSKVSEARELAQKEIESILEEFKLFKEGQKGKWRVSPERLIGRLDIKYCIPEQGRFVSKWKQKGYEIKTLEELCKQRKEIIYPKRDHPDEEFNILTIKYSGRCSTEEIRLGEEIAYSKMKVVREGDLVFSEYNAFHGAIGYITEEFDGSLASGSYIVLRCNNPDDSLYLWSILRTTEIRADLLTSAVGMGRQTIDWEEIKTVQIPMLPQNRRQKIVNTILLAWEKEKKANQEVENVQIMLDDEFGVESEESKYRFTAYKPPK
jgi:type I restriction enzyme M protein